MRSNLSIVEISVGAFMVAALLALGMLALKVSGLQSTFQEDRGFHISTEFTNVGGLKIRSKVSMAGVIIGRVTRISLDPSTFNAKVDMLIDDRFREIPDDSRVSILTAGLLGDNYVNLNAGFSDQFLKEGSALPLENTDSAMVLEQLIEKFLGQKAMEAKPSSTHSEPEQPKQEPSHEKHKS